MGGTRQPCQTRSQATKEKILESAYKLFSERGYYQTTTNHIADSAGVSIGSLYSYYKDRGEIIQRPIQGRVELFQYVSKDLFTVFVIRIEAPDRNARRHGDVVRRGLVKAAFAKKLVRRLENLLFCRLASRLAWLSRFSHCIQRAPFLW